MRAKNEFRLISEAYNIKLLAEKAVDGTLMCSKDCCGSPVMECKCGDNCKHCNCFMIQKAVKDFGLKSPLLENKNKEFAASLFAKTPEELARSKRAAERVLGKRRNPRPQHLFKKDEENESYEHKTDALVAAGTTKSEDINEIDLSKWRDYPAEDVMKAVYRQYGKELPSVDSYDWAITWDKKVRPWLKSKYDEDAEDRDRRHHPDYGEPEYDEERSERFREGPPVDSASGETTSPTLRDLATELDKQIKRKQEKSEREKAFDRRIGQIQQDFKKEDNEHPRDSMYIKDPEELKKALIWHHGNYAKLRNKSMRGGEQLTDEEYDSLKHSEGELDLHDQLER